MEKQLNLALFACLLTLVISCEHLWLEEDPVNDPLANFEFLWQEVGNKYSYFDYKEVDWDSVYSAYRPLISPDMADRELFDVLARMLNELKDGHVNLTSPFDRSRNWDWYLDFPANFDAEILYRNYLGNDYRITGPLHNQVIDSVLYVYYGSFGSTIKEEHIDFLVDRAREMKGMILDIRNNGGGSLSNGTSLASALTGEEYVYGRSRIKTGPGADDFSPWKTLTITPRSGEKYTGQVVLLCNRKSYSASTIFAQMMRSNPNAVLMGDQTGGGGGIPAYGELPNGWIYRFSSSQILNPRGEQIEGGVPVDIPVSLNPSDAADGVDTIIEAALDFLQQPGTNQFF